MSKIINGVSGSPISCDASVWTLLTLPKRPQVALHLYNISDTLMYVRYVTTGGDAPDDGADTTGAPLVATVGHIGWETIVPDVDVYVRNTHATVAKTLWLEVV